MSDKQPPTPGYIVLRSEDVRTIAGKAILCCVPDASMGERWGWVQDRIEAAIRAAAFAVHCDPPFHWPAQVRAAETEGVVVHCQCEEIASVLVPPPSPTTCTVAVTRESEPIPSQYAGEKAYTTGPCGRVLPCPEHGLIPQHYEIVGRLTGKVIGCTSGEQGKQDVLTQEPGSTFRAVERRSCAVCSARSDAPSPERAVEPHPMQLVDTCYGMTGGDLYVCERSGNRIVVRPSAAAPTCVCKRDPQKGEIAK